MIIFNDYYNLLKDKEIHHKNIFVKGLTRPEKYVIL
jgi:hypothetical protein